MSFLKAEWRKLALANYVVDASLLGKYLPFGTELDLWNNNCYVSLVGFMFLNTKLLGIKIPFHVNFEEVNLRFYVKRWEAGKWKRGVVFIKEIVPRAALTFVANTIYHENYQTLPMNHYWSETVNERKVGYSWKLNGLWQKFEVTALPQAVEIAENSDIEFITEHYWGYAKVNEKKTHEYEVRHPKWLHYPVSDFGVSVDFGKVYGSEFQMLNTCNPTSVMLAEGSDISVENKKVIESSP